MSKLLVSQRQNIKRVVDVAEDLLGYRLNRLNNSLLWSTLNRPGMGVGVDSNKKGGRGQGQAIHEDEAKVILTWMEKLKGSEHPLVKYTRQFETGKPVESSSYQIRSMVVMLVANVFGIQGQGHSLPKERRSSSSDNSSSANLVDKILSKQKALAEIAETIYTAHMLHRTVVEVPKDQMPTLGKIDAQCSSDDGEKFQGFGISMHQGNKVATLMGDLLLARCSKALSSLENSKVTEMMSDCIADFSESEAMALSARLLTSTSASHRFSNNIVPKLNNELLSIEKWRSRSSLGVGSLLRNACHSALIVSGHENELRIIAGDLGHKIGLALQAHKDYLMFENDLNTTPQIDLCSLPVIFHLETNSSLISNEARVNVVHEEVRNSSYAKARTKEELLILADDAISHLVKFTGSSSKLLQDFLVTLTS